MSKTILEISLYIDDYMYYSQIERVIKLAGEDKGVAIGALTSDNRDIWTDVSFLDCISSPTITDKYVLGPRSSYCGIPAKQAVSY